MSSKPWKSKTHVLISQIATLVIGALAILLALSFNSVLDGILHAYAFMVSGLTVPTLGAFFLETQHLRRCPRRQFLRHPAFRNRLYPCFISDV